jgi:hypothetical protein
MALRSPFLFLEPDHNIPPPRTVQASPGARSMPDAATEARLDGGDAASTFSSQSGMESMLSPPASMELDINEFMASVHSFAASTGDANHFVPPSRHRVSGYLTAYLRYFDPHTPLIHSATFRPGSTSRWSLSSFLGGQLLTCSDSSFDPYYPIYRRLVRGRARNCHDSVQR